MASAAKFKACLDRDRGEGNRYEVCLLDAAKDAAGRLRAAIREGDWND